MTKQRAIVGERAIQERATKAQRQRQSERASEMKEGLIHAFSLSLSPSLSLSLSFSINKQTNMYTYTADNVQASEFNPRGGTSRSSPGVMFRILGSRGLGA